MELPPRTRRIQGPSGAYGGAKGITSAYAENTQIGEGPIRLYPNYLRVRGEYNTPSEATCVNRELPPRTRRILFPHLKRGHVFGTTSAYAENTECSIDRAGEAGNYLRVRGEYSRIISG